MTVASRVRADAVVRGRQLSWPEAEFSPPCGAGRPYLDGLESALRASRLDRADANAKHGEVGHAEGAQKDMDARDGRRLPLVRKPRPTQADETHRSDGRGHPRPNTTIARARAR